MENVQFCTNPGNEIHNFIEVIILRNALSEDSLMLMIE